MTFGLAQGPAVHAAPTVPTNTYTVTDCSSANATVSSPSLNLDMALSYAQQPGPFPADITFSCSGDITLDQTLDISVTSHSVTIDGTGQSVTLDGGGGLRVIMVEQGASFNLNDVTITNGSASAAQAPNVGGAGLANLGTVSVTNTTFSQNKVTYPGNGGGLDNYGILSITNSVFSGNSASVGGALYNAEESAPVTISNSTFSNNVGGFILPADKVCGGVCVGGGGLANIGTLNIKNSTFNGNSTSGDASFPLGGGLANDAGTVNIDSSTFSGNSAGSGDGVYNLVGTVNVTNSAFSGNGGGAGVGLQNVQGTATIAFSTFSGNGVGLASEGGTASVSASILANNASDGGCAGSFIDQGYNLFDSGLPSLMCHFTAPSDIQSASPQISTTLANNGGPTQTLALQIGSPAINQVPQGVCPQYDQRGIVRLTYGESTCDIGAYEYLDPTLTSTASPSAVTLGAMSPVTLNASATLTDAHNPTGTITFTLVAPNNSTVDSEPVSVSGNGTYTTPTGYTLPTSSTVAGPYLWNAVYTSGDSNNYGASAAPALVTVSKASPTVSTVANPSSAAVGATLKDTADLEGGYYPTGSITFTLKDSSQHTVHTETVSVSGNGKYTTSGYTIASVGSYQWSAVYNGDGANTSATDANDTAAEQVTVTTLSTTTSLAVKAPSQPSGLKPGIAIATVGQPVTFTATVSGAPGGDVVTFTDGATTLCSNVPASSGTATCSTTYAAVGKHSITATYSGYGGYTGSSANLTLYVDTDISRYLHNGVYNLSNVKLPGAYLAGENLCGANMTNGNFSGANFSDANLCGANLSDANLSNATFTGANLIGANLTLANLKGATGLASATLSNVIWYSTTCPDNTNSANDGGSCVGHL